MIKVTDMFATPMVEARFPNHARLCAALAKLFLEQEREGERYRDPQKRLTQFGPLFESRFDLFKWTDPPVVEVARFTHTCLSQLIQQITNYGPEDLGRLRFDYHAWFHVTRKGGYQGVHNHQNASWSGIFCVDPGDPVPDRPESGLVRFYDPRTCAYYYSDAGNLGLRMPYQHGGYDLIHQAGRLVMFPSHHNPEIFPSLGARPRLVIAFNGTIN